MERGEMTDDRQTDRQAKNPLGERLLSLDDRKLADSATRVHTG